MKTSLGKVAKAIAKRTLKTDVNKQALSREIAAYLLDNDRTDDLGSLARELIRLRAEEGIVEVAAVSARKLSADVLEKLRQRVRALYPEAKRIIVTEMRDPSVIGGLRLELVDCQLDLTVRSKLNRFKQLAAIERTF